MTVTNFIDFDVIFLVCKIFVWIIQTNAQVGYCSKRLWLKVMSVFRMLTTYPDLQSWISNSYPNSTAFSQISLIHPVADMTSIIWER